MRYITVKYIIDVLIAFILLIITLPILLILSVLIYIEDPTSSPIFKQKRIGLHNKEFCIYKLRSMKTELYKDGIRLTDSQRMLNVGNLIRKFSLDELPQLVNIIRGEMSFIGPRPLSVKYLPYYTKDELKRHTVRPGISGWAQINGRNTISWEEKFYYDIEYVRNISFLFDFKIFILTIYKVFKRSGIETRGEGTEVDFHEYRRNQSSQKEFPNC